MNGNHALILWCQHRTGAYSVRSDVHRTKTTQGNKMNTSDLNTPVNTSTEPKVTDKSKRAQTNARTDFTKIIAKHASVRKIDTTRAGKELRAKARREFATLAKLDPSLLKAKTHANDGNRWPPLNAKASAHLLKRGK